MERKLIVFLSGLIFFLLPWYYTDSGLPQPVDIFILMLFVAFCLLGFPNIRQYFKYSQELKVFFIFSLYVTIILLINYIINKQQISLLLNIQNFYFVVLVILFLSMILYLQKKLSSQAYYTLILRLLLIDSIIPVLFLLKTGMNLGRAELSFNNANQLGFFALVNMSLFFYTSLKAHEQKMNCKKLTSLLIININLLFLFISASRACYPIILIYILSYMLIFKINIRGYALPLFWIIGGFLTIISILLLTYKLYLLTVQTRSVDYINIYADFYLRALHGISNSFSNIWYFLFGNGTYKTEGRTLEFHNNFLAIFNMVGLFGLLLYAYMNLLIFKNLLKRGFYYLVPYFCYLIYSMLHYSYRTRVNWILLAMFIFIIMDVRTITQRKLIRNEL